MQERCNSSALAMELCLSYINPLMYIAYIDGSVQDCSNSIANALELLKSCTKPSILHNHDLTDSTTKQQWYDIHG